MLVLCCVSCFYKHAVYKVRFSKDSANPSRSHHLYSVDNERYGWIVEAKIVNSSDVAILYLPIIIMYNVRALTLFNMYMVFLY